MVPHFRTLLYLPCARSEGFRMRPVYSRFAFARLTDS